MRARLRKDERNIVYDIEIDDDLDYQSKNMLSVWKKTVEAIHFVKEYATMDDLLEEWEILQEPSEQTRQAIEKTIEANMSIWMKPKEMAEAVCRVLEGQE